MASTDETPAGSAVWHCPLPTCKWTFEPPPPDPNAPGPAVAGATLEESISVAAFAIMGDWCAVAEVALEAHLATHTTLEWATEIMRLRAEADGLRKVARAASEWDALIEAAAPMSYVMDARELERQERKAEQAVRDAVGAARESGLEF